MEELVLEYQSLIYKIARKFYNVPLEDLFQVGVMGLIKASKKYNKNFNTKFSSFAYEYIFGEMYSYVFNNQEIKVSKDYLKLIKLINETKNLLLQQLHREPSTLEISLYLDIDEQDIEEAISYALSFVSMDDDNYIDDIGFIEDKDELIDLRNLIDSLKEPERSIMVYRYFQDMTQGEVAKKLKMSQVTVSRIERKTIKELKKVA